MLIMRKHWAFECGYSAMNDDHEINFWWGRREPAGIWETQWRHRIGFAFYWRHRSVPFRYPRIVGRFW